MFAAETLCMCVHLCRCMVPHAYESYLAACSLALTATTQTMSGCAQSSLHQGHRSRGHRRQQHHHKPVAAGGERRGRLPATCA